MVKQILKKKTLFVLVMMVLPMVAINAQTSLGSAKENSLPSVVKIGFLYPKTGDLGAIGQGLMDGAVAAAYRINQTESNYKVQIVAQDTQTDPATTKTVTQTLISDGVKVIVGAAASGDTLAAAEVTIPNQVPLISYASTSPAITALNDSDYVFRVVASDAYQGQALAQLAWNRSVKNAWILNLDNAYGNGVAAQFESKYVSLGGTVAGQTKYDPTSSSYATEISTIKQSNADGVVIVAYPDSGNKIFAEAQTQGVDLPWFGTDGIASSSVTNNSATRDYVVDKLFGTTPSTGVGASDTLYSQFTSDLTATGGSYGVYGDYVYDAFLVVEAALNKAGTYDGKTLRDDLYAAANGLKGATSANKAFNCDGEPISQSYDYWNASDYSVTTMIAHAVTFTGLGSAATAPCGDHPYTGTFVTSSPGFEGIPLLFAVLGLVSIKYIGKRKRN
jgi:ABC-type branched-subunit amino acid transport system substrate-binding protein